MKNRKPTSLIAALSLLLPIGAWAQAESTGSSGSSSPFPSSNSSTPSAGSQQYPSSDPSRQGSNVSTDMSSSHGQQLKLIKGDKLKDKKLTAENLRGKKVVDRDGQTIGKVKDIGLGSALQQDGHGSSHPYASSDSVDAGAPTGGSFGASSSSASSTTGAGAMTGRPSGAIEELTLYIELDDSVEIEGDDLAAIPASKVRFDSDKKELKLQFSRSELAAQLKPGSNSSNR